MTALVRTIPGRRTVVAPPRVVLMVIAVGLLAVMGTAVFALAHALSVPGKVPNPIVMIDGVPTGIEHSAAGAVAAADEYVAVAYDSVEKSPARDTALIDTDYAPQIRAAAIQGAAAVRAENPDAMALWHHGGQSITLVGARRLDYYGGDAAETTTWSANVIWGPQRPPKQNWVLTQTWLRWSADRWLVISTTTLPIGGPVPALTPQSTPTNDSTAAFGADLSGYSAPGYGSPG
jgi:hypothetical protein